MESLGIILSIIVVDILLSGDNALIIALACRRLSEGQRKKAIFWGCGGAITLRVVLTVFAVILLKIPFVHLVGGFLLLWIAIKLVISDSDDKNSDEHIKPAKGLYEAVKTIIIADFVMSLDNVIALAGVSRGNVFMLILGLAVTIPLIIWGSKLILWLINRYPIIVLLGGAFLGYTGGEMVMADGGLKVFAELYPQFKIIVPIIFAIIVFVSNHYLSRKMVHQDNS